MKRLGLNRTASISLLAPRPRKEVYLYSLFYLAQVQWIYYLLIESCCQIQFEWPFSKLTSLLTLSIVVKTQRVLNILLPLDCFWELDRRFWQGRTATPPLLKTGPLCLEEGHPLWWTVQLQEGWTWSSEREGDAHLVSHIIWVNPGGLWGDRCLSHIACTSTWLFS